MLLQVLQDFTSLSGHYFLLTEVVADNPSDKNLAGNMFLAPSTLVKQHDEHTVKNKDKFKVDEGLLQPYALPKTAHPQGHRQNRLLKYILTVFYELNAVAFIQWQEARKDARIQTAELAYQRISGRSAYTEFRRNHFQLVTRHADLRFSEIQLTGSYSYVQVRTYYENEGVVLCRWNLGDDGIDEILVHDEADGGKRIVNPIMSMSIYRHYQNERIQTLNEVIADEKNYQGEMIRSFFTLRSLEHGRLNVERRLK